MYIVADMQLCFATTEAIETEFAKDDLVLAEVYSDGNLSKRTITEDDETIYVIDYLDYGISVTNHLRDYSYTIEFLQEAQALKKALIPSVRFRVSLVPAVSYGECIASWAAPMSTVGIEICVVEMLPKVLPPVTLELLKNSW